MAVIIMVFRKMARNKWLIASLLAGYILFTALMCSIPLYTNGIMQNLLTSELEAYQAHNGIYTGIVRVESDYSYYVGGWDVRKWLYNDVTSRLEEGFIAEVGVPAAQKTVFHSTKAWKAIEDYRERDVPRGDVILRFGYMTDFERHMELIAGRLPSVEPVDGVYEVLVPEIMTFEQHIEAGDEFLVHNALMNPDLGDLMVRVAGVYRPCMDEPLYWVDDMSKFNNTVFLNGELFEEVFLKDFIIDDTTWYCALDYYQIKVYNVDKVYGAYDSLYKWIREKGFKVYMPAMDLLPKYNAHREQLTPLLFSLYSPIIVMLLFYLFMVSSLVIERQKNEIAVLISRGAGRLQLLFSYLLEALILGIVGMAVGPFLGVALARILGSTTNFLEFVHRVGMEIEMNSQTLIYAAIAVILSISATLLPVIPATGTNILEHKRNVSRLGKSPLWQRLFLDFILIGVSLYGIYQFNRRQQDLLTTGADSLSIDPLLFVNSAIFAFGLGLFFIRFFPLFVEGLYRIGRRFWPLTIYTGLIQAARSARRYQFLMLFIIITISTGLFSATAARTINQNAEDKIRYHYGADHILKVQWPTTGSFGTWPEGGSPSIPAGVSLPERDASGTAHFQEPPYGIFRRLAGVKSTARVFDTTARVYGSRGTVKVRLMGIEPKEFGETAWFPEKLTKYHWYHDLNQVSRDQAMVLISRSAAQNLGLDLWDTFTMNWSPNGMAEFMVAGVIDYWPTWNPNLKLDEKNDQYDMLVVANLSYLYDNALLQPYDIWLKLEEGASIEALYKDIQREGIKLKAVSDMGRELVTLKRDPFYMGINGALTLGFLISAIIILSGFFIFWILAIYQRMFQSGIMLAMGIKLRELIAMMIWEQLLTSVTPMLSGVLIGRLASSIFVPMLQMSFSAAEQVPPFRVVAQASDYIKIYWILGVMMAAGLIVIAWMLSRLKIYSCIKLGEES
jgi:putative ABC transport system permease protein